MNQPEQSKGARKLSPRELEIILCVADGLKTQQIADKLGINRDTVESHRHNIIKATHCNNMPHVIAHCLRSGIIY